MVVKMTYAYRLLTDGTGYVDETGPHRGVPPTQDDFDRIAFLCAQRTMFAQGKTVFEILNPLPQSEFPSMIEIEQEMPIEEAKKRWPNTPVTGE